MSKKRKRAWHRAVIPDYATFSNSPGVVCVGLGVKEVGGKLTRRRCVKIYVRRKQSETALEHKPFPKTTRVLLPSGKGHYEMVRLPTDIVELGDAEFALKADDTYSVVPSGAEIGWSSSPPATLGCVVKRQGDDRLLILTVGHLITGSGNVPANLTINQPQNNSAVFLGQTTEGFVGNDFNLGGYIDGVLVAIDDNRFVTNASWDARVPVPTRFLPQSTIVNQQPAVHKVGAATGYTCGVYSGHLPSIPLNVNGVIHQCYNVLEFQKSDDCPMVSALTFAARGDSGSIIISRSPGTSSRVVGMLFAVWGHRAFVIPFERLASRFRIQVAPGFSAPPQLASPLFA